MTAEQRLPVIVVDADRGARQQIVLALSHAGYAAEGAPHAVAAFDRVRARDRAGARPVAVLVTALDLPGAMDGAELALCLGSEQLDLGVVYLLRPGQVVPPPPAEYALGALQVPAPVTVWVPCAARELAAAVARAYAERPNADLAGDGPPGAA